VEDVVDEEDIRLQRDISSRALPSSMDSVVTHISAPVEESVPPQRGEKSTHKINKSHKDTRKSNHKINNTHRGHKDTQTSDHKDRNTYQNIQTKLEYCQPTSSKTKVEDLVTDEMEKEILNEINKEKRKVHRSFWEHPVPNPKLDWMYDPRMPQEMNQLLYDMTAYRNQSIVSIKNGYREPYPDEVSDSVSFDEIYPESRRIRQNHLKSRNRLYTEADDVNNISKLRARFEKPKPKIAHKAPSVEIRAARDTKGKAKAIPTEEDIPQLREHWRNEYDDIVNGTPSKLPPFREINHEIHLIDENRRYNYHAPRCPQSLRAEFYEKLNRYVTAGWWTANSATQAAPLMCIPKKDGKLRTVVDCRQRNDNTIKDVTPLPDQEIIREDVARAKYRSKIDLTDAYEQVRIRPEDVHKTAFSTIAGTYVSNVIQIGDCNAPATFQRLMTFIFRDCIGQFLHVYLDDMFIFSDTIEDHEKYLKIIFDRLRKYQLYLKWAKCELYAKEIDCLGHMIDDEGIHPDTDKLDRIRGWRTPRNYNDIQRFVGLVNYVGNFLPNISVYSGPLMAMTQNGAPFLWRPIHQRCFDMIKHLCSKTPVLQPVKPEEADPIWVICDASKSGVGAMYGQGPSWNKCRPAGFMSRKFTSAQHNYAVHELETLAILEALMKWEDKLVGYKIHIITDHKALEFFKTQNTLSYRQRRWMDYLSRFDFDITYVKGELNKVADCLSRYYENDTPADVYEPYEYVNADVRIDKNGDDLPLQRYKEVFENTEYIRMMEEPNVRRSNRLRQMKDRVEAREKEAAELKDVSSVASEVQEPLVSTIPPEDKDVDPTLGDTLADASSQVQPTQIRNDAFIRKVKQGYASDRLFKFVIADPDKYRQFVLREGILYTRNQNNAEVLCVPQEDRDIVMKIIDQAHIIVGHFSSHKTASYVRRWYWWPRMGKDIEAWCTTCVTCQTTKTSNKQPAGKLHPLPIPTKPWDSIGMDFIGPFPEAKGFNYLWVIICRMTSMVHLIPVHTTMKASELSWVYRREIVRLHGLPSTIVSDHDSKFTSKWWTELHKIMGAKLLMSTSFHPQTDGQTEHANRSIGQIFRATVAPDQKNWVDCIDLTEFAINASVSETTKYALFELNGGYLPSMIREIKGRDAPKGVREFARTALDNLARAHDAIIEARVFQTVRANKKRSDEPLVKVGDLVFLSTENLNLPKNRTRKLRPKFIGPYRVLKVSPDTSTYVVDLPPVLQRRRVKNTFHVSLLRPYQASSDALFPNRATPEPYDFGAGDDQEWYVDDIIGHRRNNLGKLEYEVRWSLGDTTWEPHEECKRLEALDRYLELHRVHFPSQLPRAPKGVAVREVPH
jgi:hypothetical protein